MLCLKDSLSDTNPLIQKQKKKMQTLIKRPSRLSTKKKKRKKNAILAETERKWIPIIKEAQK